MSIDTQRLIEKYNESATAGSAAAEVRSAVYEMPAPKWDTYPQTKPYEQLLSPLKPETIGESNNKTVFKGSASAKAIAAALSLKDGSPQPLQYILTIVYDMLREDSSNFTAFEEFVKSGGSILSQAMGLLNKKGDDVQWIYVSDKAAWLLSAIIGRMPKYFSEEDVSALLKAILAGNSCSELGVLDVIVNLLKADIFRAAIWSFPGVSDRVLSVESKTTPSPILYKSVFAVWMLSFDTSLAASLKSNQVVQKIKSILVSSRTEKVIRICLTVLKNFLAHKKECKVIVVEIVEEGVLEAVQQLEYEKWRDNELYDDIRELTQLISSEVKELSNFDRYMRELESGSLTWGFIHSSKFFGENIMKFDTADFKALKLLGGLLNSHDPTTLAVACHDMGEFVSLHPVGKREAAKLNVKEKVMLLMSWPGENSREVRREALLCCQKIMLNKWQEVAGEKK